MGTTTNAGKKVTGKDREEEKKRRREHKKEEKDSRCDMQGKTRGPTLAGTIDRIGKERRARWRLWKKTSKIATRTKRRH
jgi:hypothetical protein